MKKLLFIAVLLSSSAAFAQTTTTTSSTTTAPAAAGAPAMSEASFADRKAELMKRLAEHISEMQKVQSCAQAANDADAMRACFPVRPGMGGPGAAMHPGMSGQAAPGGAPATTTSTSNSTSTTSHK